MRKTTLILTIILTTSSLYCQTMFSGFIDKYPIELVTDTYSDGDAKAIYAYSDRDEPIVTTGTLKNKELTLYEKDAKNINSAKLTFNRFDLANSRQEGIWTDLKTNKEFKITLDKTFEINCGDSIEWENREILQPVSLDNKYFKLIVSKKKGEFQTTVTGVKILEKKTDKLLQKLNVDCQLMGLENISIGDFNFDGIFDFSVFETSYAGANTSSLYFLYDTKSEKYIESGFSGVSLEFDSEAKRIYERNQSCAGSVVTTAEYKVVNNKMVLIKEHCYIWDETKQDMVERKLKDCE
ncbi:MAG: hypothetical protein PHR83_16815 [Paludibacter sp.]|nr:hypothetical protein [Paludibacter sp.]